MTNNKNVALPVMVRQHRNGTVKSVQKKCGKVWKKCSEILRKKFKILQKKGGDKIGKSKNIV